MVGSFVVFFLVLVDRIDILMINSYVEWKTAEKFANKKNLI